MGRKHPLANCSDCPFEHEPFVPTQNLHPKSKIAVVGEAPGAYEAARGIPFTGPSGRLLDQVLAHHGIARSEVMVTNVCLCRPENNDDPPKAAIAACKPRLDAEITASGVEKIIAVGGTAASALIDPKKKISNLRIGPAKPYIENSDINVVATWHPAYCLRAPDAFPSFVSDLFKLKAKDNVSWSPPNYRSFEDRDIILQAIDRLYTVEDPIAIDIECGVEKDISYVHPDQYNLLCLGISYATGKAVVFGGSGLHDKDVQVALGNYLRRRKIIAHNGKFDLAGLYPIIGSLELWFDTMLASYCLDERPGLHALEKLSIENLGSPDWKSEIQKYLLRGAKDYSNIPNSVLYKYNAIDTCNTRSLWKLFSSKMGPGSRELAEHTFLVRASNALMNLERAGIKFDEDYSEELGKEFEKELFDLELEISRITGINLNPRSPQQVERYLASNGVFVANTQAETLEKILERVVGFDDPKSILISDFIRQLLLHRKRTKLYGTYVKGFRKRLYADKIYTTYTLHGTTSGRLASKNPNMQNIVRDKRIKHQFTVEHEDNILVHADYKQAEGRVITTLARDEYLRDIFCDPTRDIFDELCNDIYGVGKWVKENRVSMKSIFYGNAYGRGVNAIALELQQQGSSITIAETKTLMAEFNARISKVIQWQTSIKQKVLSGEDLTTPFGRKRSFWLITEQNRIDVLNEALSFLPQSIASDICLSALIELQPRLQGLATTRLTIHDAIIFECRKQDAEEVASIARDEMAASGLRYTSYVPFAIDISTGKRWSEL